jgi:hypothetical protein
MERAVKKLSEEQAKKASSVSMSKWLNTLSSKPSASSKDRCVSANHGSCGSSAGNLIMSLGQRNR